MNRTDRLYALVEELRAVAPRPRSASWLARRFEVGVRTIERDLDGLRDAGVAITSVPGRSGGYTLDPGHTLPPLALTAAEALAISVALRSVAGSPFAADARTAAQKIRARLPADVRAREDLLAGRVHVVATDPPGRAHERVVRDGIARQRVVRLTYGDPLTERDVEPLGLVWAEPFWYLVGWCRLRNGIRGFRLDRIRSAGLTDESIADVHRAELERDLARFDVQALTDVT